MNERRKEIEADINAAWAAGSFSDAYDKISADLCPILRASLRSKRINHQDAEDIVASAMSGFAKKLRTGPTSIAKPCNYLQAAVTNCLRTHIRKARRLPLGQRDERDQRQIIDTTATQPTINNRKVFLIQAVTQDEEIAESDARRLVAAVLKDIRPIYQRILRDLLKHGPYWTLAEAAARVGVKPGTYAVQKTRAYAAFKQRTGPIAEKLKIHWRGIEEDTAYFPESAEDDDELAESADLDDEEDEYSDETDPTE